ncbi:hypothetical protein BKA59DRAFT_488012 [Fusarium tricinctum]|jgi:hypothetical protein|uniref:Uncharacterized protein n=2 Tax=Fusarium tricinctum species complex TaxID=679429 RepID=A0A8K0W791_9HYPO|nr:hypothetical protein BKA59DRAFT_488012 [Fusarium tricinctum]
MSTNQDAGEIRKNIEATIDSFLLAYEDGREANDPSIINRVVTPDCTRQLLPASLCEALGVPPEFLMPNDMYEKLFADDLALGGVYNTTPRHLVIDVEARRAAVSTTGDFKYHDGEVIALEFAFAFYFNDDGTKISKVIEVADSNAVLKMAAKARAHTESAASTASGKETGAKNGDDIDLSKTG